MARIVDIPRDVWRRKNSHGFDDCFEEVLTMADTNSQGGWYFDTTTDGFANMGPAGVALSTAVNDGGDGGDETALLYKQSKMFQFLASRPIAFGARVALSVSTAANTSCFIGLSNVVADGLMVAGSGNKMIATSNECVGFFAYEGSAVAEQLSTIHQVDTTATENLLNASNSLDNQAHGLVAATVVDYELVWRPTSSTLADVEFYIDGSLVTKETSVSYATSPLVMAPVFCVQSGPGTTIETLTCEHMYCYQTRA